MNRIVEAKEVTHVLSIESIIIEFKQRSESESYRRSKRSDTGIKYRIVEAKEVTRVLSIESNESSCEAKVRRSESNPIQSNREAKSTRMLSIE